MVQAVRVCYSIFNPSAERLHQKIVGQLLLELISISICFQNFLSLHSDQPPLR